MNCPCTADYTCDIHDTSPTGREEMFQQMRDDGYAAYREAVEEDEYEASQRLDDIQSYKDAIDTLRDVFDRLDHTGECDKQHRVTKRIGDLQAELKRKHNIDY